MTVAVGPPTPALRRVGLRERAMSAPSWALSMVGLGSLVLVWWALGHVWLSENEGLPTPFNVLKSLYDDGWSFYWPIVSATVGRAIPGYLLGNGIGLGLAFLVLLVPMTERVVMQIAVASYCLPIVAVGPILTITLSGAWPTISLIILFVLFTTLVGSLLGMRSADPTSLDLVAVYGGGTWTQLRKVRLIAALPSILNSLKLSCPIAVLGAILGEYFGGTINTGLGFTMTASEQALNVPRTWACGLVAAAVGGIGYAAIGLLTRFLTPWTRATTAGGAQ